VGTIELKKVKSSNIKALGYNKELKELYVMFNNNTIYKYTPVEEHAYDSFKTTQSIGKFFYAFIKSNKLYKFEKVNPQTKEIEIKE